MMPQKLAKSAVSVQEALDKLKPKVQSSRTAK
jgi:hypothetical protein